MKRPAEANLSPDSKRMRIQAQPPQPSPRLTNSAVHPASNTPKLTPKMPVASAKPSNSAAQWQSSPVAVQSAAPPVSSPAMSMPTTSTPQSSAAASTATAAGPVHQPLLTLAAATVAASRSTPPNVHGLNAANLQKFMDFLKENENKMVAETKKVAALEAEGKFEEAKTIREALQRHMQALAVWKNRIAASARGQKQPQGQSPTPGGVTNSSGINPPASASPSKEITSQSPNATLLTPHMREAKVNPHPAATASPLRTPAQPLIAPHVQESTSPVIPQAASPQTAAQMQRLIEPRDRTPLMTNAAVLQDQGQPPHSISAQPVAPHWRGFLTWSGSDSGTHVRRDMQASVQLTPLRNGETMFVEI